MQLEMKTVYTKIFQGFTVTILHDSENCVRCMKLSSFYNKMKNKEPPWDQTNMKGRSNSAVEKYQFFGLISYLDNLVRIEYLPYDEYKNVVRNQNPLLCIELVNGRICYYREATPEERTDINQQFNRNFTSRLLRKRMVDTDKSMPGSSPTKSTLSYRGYRKVIRNAVRRSCRTNQTPEKSTERTLKDKIIHCKKIQKTHKAKKDSHAVQDSSPPTHDTQKEPGKGTLKRKRWILNKLKNNDGYEDDIFEEKTFYSVQNMQDEDSDSSDIENMATPKWNISLSPRERSASPTYEDCYSLSELSASRKEAEEYQFRRYKRRKTMLLGDKTDVSSQKIKSETPDSTKVLESVCKILLKAEKDSGSESEDSYFSDPSDEEL